MVILHITLVITTSEPPNRFPKPPMHPAQVPLQVLLPLLPAKVEDGKDLQGGSHLACHL